MFQMEGFEAKRNDGRGTEFNFLPGDILLIYTDSSSDDDVITGGLY